MTVILRDYQRDTVDKIYQSWQQGARNVCAVLPTGAGKSVIVSEIVNNAYRANQRVAVVAHRNELVTQMACHIARRGIPHRIVAANSTITQVNQKERSLFGKSFVNFSAPIAVVGVDTLMSRADSLKEWANQVHLWVIDECFPAGTFITTKDGFIKIEDVKVGDEVLAFDEKNKTFSIKKVIETFKNPIHDNMMSLTFKGHHVVKCTKNHPFYTKRGWVKASDLTLKDKVLYHEKHNVKMYSLWKRNYNNGKLQSKQIHKNRQNLLFNKLRCGLQIKNIIRNNGSDESKICFTTNERTKSYEKSRSERKALKNFKSYESQTHLSRWKWKRSSESGKNSFGLFGCLGFYRTMCCQNRSLSRRVLSDMLQNRCWKPCVENRYRSRRSFSRFFAKTRTRQEKGAVSKWVGLEDIKVYKPRNTGEHGKSYVYNIGVADFHTYVANGFVVHNCHHTIRGNKWGKAVEMFTNAYGLGVTATPARADGQGLGRQADGVADAIIIGPTSRQLIELGHLSDYEIVCPKSDLNVENIKLSADGDWCSKNLKKVAKESRIVGDVVENYKKYALGRKAIVFATDVETADNIASSFNETGIRAASVNGKSKTSWREQSLSDFASGKTPVLVNVDLFDEGFDCFDTETEILTEHGWKNYETIKTETKCYGFNSKTEKVELVDIKKYGVRNIKPHEKMLSVKSQHTDFCVTENHRIFYKNVNYYKYPKDGLEPVISVDTALNVYNNPKNKFALPLCGEKNFKGLPLSDNDISLLGWYYTDGYLEHGKMLSITQIKKAQVEKLKELFEKTGYKYSVRQRTFKSNYSGQTQSYVFLLSTKDTKKLLPYMNKQNVPECLNDMTKEQFSVFWSSMMDGNGSRKKNSSGFCCTPYKSLADFVNQAAVLRGFASSCGFYKTKNDVQIYNITVRDSKWLRFNPKDKRGAVFNLFEPKKDTKVWCIQNELGTLITRRHGKIVILGNCPDADVCIMARPTASLAKYLQMIGRVLRPQSNKTALVIDHVSNVIRHGLPDRYRIWTLNRREKRSVSVKDPEALDLKVCPYCLKPYEAFRTVCPYCGQAKPLPEPRSRSIQMVDGDLVLLDKAALERMRAQTILESPEDIQARVARTQGIYAGKHIAKCQREKIEAQKNLIDSIAQWAGIQRVAGFTDQELYRKFYLTTGTDVLSALSASHTRQEYQDMADLVKGWYE